ncbi:leucyl aminopeptidase, partial [Synechococcus sp. MU1644]|nr:leucyl aminopeptidase [Synechococcus sp. MU1644]
MTDLTPVTFTATDLDALAGHEGRVAVIVTPEGKLEQSARRVNRLTKGAIQRFVDSAAFEKVKAGQVTTFDWPVGLAAESLDVICLARNHSVEDARKAGAALGKLRGGKAALLAADGARRVAEIVFGLVMRDYDFSAHKTDAEVKDTGVLVMCSKPEDTEAAAGPLMAIADGTFMTRD